jgi:hypothetical protein
LLSPFKPIGSATFWDEPIGESTKNPAFGGVFIVISKLHLWRLTLARFARLTVPSVGCDFSNCRKSNDDVGNVSNVVSQPAAQTGVKGLKKNVKASDDKDYERDIV